MKLFVITNSDDVTFDIAVTSKCKLRNGPVTVTMSNGLEVVSTFYQK
jgi:hypothetical protein